MYILRNDGKKYILPAGTNISDSKEIYTDVLTVPTETADNNWAMQYDGEERNIMINIILYDSSVDLSDGTNTTEVKTVKEQYSYLNDFIQASYQFSIYLDNGVTISPLAVENLNLTQDAGEINMKARVRFKMGEVI